MGKDFEIEFVPEKKEDHIKKLWDDIVFRSTISWYVVKGYFMWFISMGYVEIEVGYEENGEMHYYLHLEKLW